MRVFKPLKLITDFPSQKTDIAVRHGLLREKLRLKDNYELNPPSGYLEISRIKTESVALHIIKIRLNRMFRHQSPEAGGLRQVNKNCKTYLFLKQAVTRRTAQKSGPI